MTKSPKIREVPPHTPKIKTVAYSVISYQYYCGKCSKTFKFVLDFDDRLKPYACPTCGSKLKYNGGAALSVSQTGNCQYQSAEKISAQNIKRIGNEQYQRMCEEDPVVQKRIEQRDSPKPWYQNADGPLDLNTIKDIPKFIETGAKD